ncbi:MAG: DUF1830 domain-containing protein [Pseudanabaenaceae cyanobacterium]
MPAFDQLPAEYPDATRILCCYINATGKVQIARITNIDNWYFERVVFPGQRLVFETLPDALLEIHTGTIASSILSDTIPCKEIEIAEPMTIPEWAHSKPLEAVS